MSHCRTHHAAMSHRGDLVLQARPGVRVRDAGCHTASPTKPPCPTAATWCCRRALDSRLTHHAAHVTRAARRLR